MRRRHLLKTGLIVGVLVVISPFLWDATAYIYALRLEHYWLAADPQTRQELETHLSLYSTRQIQTEESSWGNYYQLAENERMIQYRILWKAELDVVYDDRDNVVMILTSYE